jgi:hypothetical protein
MLKHLITALTVVAGCVIAAAASHAQGPSQTTLTGTVRAAPEKAGTVRRPAGVKVQGKVRLMTPERGGSPIVTAFEIWHGPGLVFDRKRFPACRITALSMGGPRACPPKSIMGRGQLLHGPLELEDYGTDGTVTFINAAGGRTAAWIVLHEPARVQAAAVGTVVDSASGPWPHRETYTIPQSLQVVAGIPITLNGLSFAIGGKSWAKTYTASTGCPAGGWAWKVRVPHARDDGGRGRDRGRRPGPLPPVRRKPATRWPLAPSRSARRACCPRAGPRRTPRSSWR